MNYRVLSIFVSVFLMLFSPALSGIIFDGEYVSQKDELDKLDLENKEISLYVCSSGTCEKIDFEEYICGVVLAEVPSSYNEEALKAMAVAIRSYTLRRLENQNKDIAHFSADVCDDFSHCQAYISYDMANEKYGELLCEEAYAKIKKAVDDTKGEILYYNGEIADAVYHSSSPEYTESAKNVWGFDVPYLVSVPSGEENQALYMQYDAEEFAKLISDADIKCTLGDDVSKWVSDVVKNESGRVQSIKVGTTVVSGRRIREIFGLRSTSFDLSYSDGFFTFCVKGYGHGVGMSQQGAEAMACSGTSYKDILGHYYRGTELGLY